MSTDTSNSITPAPVRSVTADGDMTMTEDPTLSWLNMDLDSLLAQSLPPLDMSLYQSMGELAPLPSETVPSGQPDSDPFGFTNMSISPMVYGQSVPNPQPILPAPQSIQYAPLTPQLQLILRDFCKSL